MLKKENVETRLDNIEEILKMLLVNSVLGSSEIDKIQENILNDVRDGLLTFGMEKFTDLLWTSLNEENKVSLFVRYVDIGTGAYETKIVNKNQR